MGEVQLWVSTVEVGCFFALLGLAFLLVWQGTGDFNFAIGPLAMIAALCASWLVVERDAALWPSLAAGVALVLVLSAVIELGVVRPISSRTTHHLPVVVAIAAVLFALMQGAGVVFGRSSLPGQQILTFDPVTVGDSVVLPSTILLVVTTLVAFVLVIGWVRLTPSGRLLRAVGNNPDAANVIGLPVSRVRVTAFLVAGMLAALAGLLYAPKSGVGFDRGLTWTIAGFLVVVVGGTGTIWAPLVAGLLLGMLEIFLPYYFSASTPDYVLLVLALGFFAFRPEGLFMKRVRA
ncbi:branched-chain amino acid ABC transporter permease [Iamia majanohamensis]|uniref:Branched-chain amino acid ABC transporter permease n=1 Tax=Iamia majanohamensis TaxID=467976 RepID=A0AAF0BWT9_9ACTN|nr:branched-chain amino acid ABC transporter permease [Iamia majanohamensis]WCO67824.1 branched-chain amino acid ABC transporter permease [Iamia majanohamensis]